MVVGQPASASGATKVAFHVRAGFVADFVPTSEYEESLNNAKALVKAVEIAQAGF